MKRETELLIKGVNLEIEEVLRKFNYIVNAELKTVIINNVSRKATLKDRIELIESEWCNTVEALEELGVKIEK